MRVVCWGTYDLGKPRNRILLRGLRETGVELIEIHSDVWAGIEDKGHIRGIGSEVVLLVKWLAAYPRLIWRYLRAPRHDVVLVGYMGHLDVLVIWPFAKLRGAPVVWDVFLSLYNTVVEDRRMISAANPMAWLIYGWEWLACRAGTLLVMDTRTHGQYLARRFGIDESHIESIFVGVEPEAFPPMERKRADEPDRDLTVLFYGQFIPLHGIETIVRAAQAKANQPIQWILIGSGQEENRIRDMLSEAPCKLDWIEWVDYDELREYIAQADVCLGIFGDTEKAARVIPNKVFQILSSGAPLITRDSPAIRELLSPAMEGVYLVPPADPDALLNALGRFAADCSSLPARPLHSAIAGQVSPEKLGARLRNFLANSTNALPSEPTP